MPLTSTRNAEFLHNEVPGIKLNHNVRDRMRFVSNDRDKSIEQGISIAKELIDVSLRYFHGIYLITPFARYDMIIRLIEYIQEKVPKSNFEEVLSATPHSL